VGIIDIDHFKNVNDRFGHIFGDEMLLLFAGMMKKEFRNTDLLFRFGGEEFVVFLLNINEQEAFNKFDGFRQRLQQFVFLQINTITVSIGITQIDTQFHSTKLLEQADQALYYAKEHGRNQVRNYHHLINAGSLSTLQIDNKIDLF
jgi:diguanylate cyclase (GGDEF)-like protein